MKLIHAITLSIAVTELAAGLPATAKSDLVILHTNDTHSMIDPDAAGEGGVLQRKAIIDSVRKAEKNVILVDAGDVVQGTLYFKFFKGDVEYPLMNMMGYDIQIPGNHEFDNGLEELAGHYKNLNADLLSANYDMAGTPMEGLLKPYVIREIDGKRVGFIGINIDPSSLISAKNYSGMGFSDPIATANRMASLLKNEENADLVVAVTHIGAEKENDKPTDYDLAAASRDIDIIIGGHSHTVIPPDNTSEEFPSIVGNADGHPVMIAQTGRYGKYLGYIKIDMDNPDRSAPDAYTRRLIPVTDRFPSVGLDKGMDAFIAPYRERLAEIDRHVIGRSDREMKSYQRTGPYVNWSADFAKWYGDLKADSLRKAGHNIPRIDMGMMNVGGIRHSMPKGDVTEGMILATFPFSNRMVIVRIKGSDFAEAMQIAAAKGGEAVSDEVRVLTDESGRNVEKILISGKPLDPERYYYLSTIDYLAWGNDDFIPLSRGEIVWTDDPEMSAPMMRYLKTLSDAGLPVDGDPRPRFLPIVRL